MHSFLSLIPALLRGYLMPVIVAYFTLRVNDIKVTKKHVAEGIRGLIPVHKKVREWG